MGSFIETVGQRIRVLRKEANLTLQEAADRVGMDGIFWGKVERGQTNATLDTIERMMEALDVEPLEIFAFVVEPREEGEESIFIDLLRHMTPDARQQILALARFLAGAR